MYKNITYFNKYKSVKKYEKDLLNSLIFENLVKTKERKNEITYVNPDLLITIKKTVVIFLIFNYKNYHIINKINQLCDLNSKG